MIEGLKIVAYMPFFRELDLLEIKLASMPFVDQFVVGESRRTFTGNCKPLYLADNASRFDSYPIAPFVIDDATARLDPWEREDAQYGACHLKALKLNPDILIGTDTDEPVTQSAAEEFIAHPEWPIAALEQDWLIYYFNRCVPKPWIQRTICRNGSRNKAEEGMPLIKNAGWHFNFITDQPTLLDKINATSHSPENGSPGYFDAIYRGEKPGLETAIPYPEENLPQFIRDNRARFSNLFA